jgi:hypothetical protein
MKHYLKILILLAGAQAIFAVSVDGYCYLESESDHSGTKVKFIEAGTSVAVDSVFTEPSGHFDLALVSGVYDVEYSHGTFENITTSKQRLAADTTLTPAALRFVGHRISGSLKGTLEPGMYRIVGNITVVAGDTLRLLPGTIFFFARDNAFTVRGTLLAEGTAKDSILFTTNIHARHRYWAGLRFMDASSSGSRLAYCSVEYAKGRAGGLYCRKSSPAFADCVIRHNSAQWGGGILCSVSSPTFINCTISGNEAKYGGGGVYGRLSALTFQNCTIAGNSTRLYGGGIYGRRSSLVFSDCTVTGNSTGWYGGGAFCSNSSVSFRDCTIMDNSAGHEGNGIYRSNSSLSLARCAMQ